VPLPLAPLAPPAAQEPGRIAVLDGLRAWSILLVLAAHLLPLGPRGWEVNESVGIAGMGLFFALSGFLVTTQLLENDDVRRFLVRRCARILPLAWTYMAVALTFDGADAGTWAAQLLFFANVLHPQALTPATAHLWSLCVEMQFYLLVAATVAVAGRRGLPWVVLLGAAITLWRIHQGVYGASRTELRADEILAGSMLALLWHQAPLQLPGTRATLQPWLRRLPIPLVVLLYAGSCTETLLWLAYLRPYLAALLLGTCMAQSDAPLAARLAHPRQAYVAAISYALYVIHPLLTFTWLGSGDTLERYLKRPLLFAVLLLLAHASTFYFESTWTRMARNHLRRPRPATAHARPPGGSP
jgi:peptidoglycan/LPS O-acetylase OafA/YrhL